jgi:hypothetical protein
MIKGGIRIEKTPGYEYRNGIERSKKTNKKTNSDSGTN